MIDALLIFFLGFSSGFVIAWVLAMYWLFKKDEQEVKE